MRRFLLLTSILALCMAAVTWTEERREGALFVNVNGLTDTDHVVIRLENREGDDATVIARRDAQVRNGRASTRFDDVQPGAYDIAVVMTGLDSDAGAVVINRPFVMLENTGDSGTIDFEVTR